MRLFARFWPFGRPQSNPPPVGPQFHPLESNRNPSKMYSMFGGSFSQFSVYQCFPFSPLYLMFCGAYLRIDLCPRKRTRIRRQKQDEDVHLFLSERKKARPLPGQGSWPGTRRDPNACTRVGAGPCGGRRIWPGTRRDPNARTTVGAYCIRPPNGPVGPNGTYPAGL